MSYIQIEIGGRLRGLKFTQGTTMLLQNSPVMEMDSAERSAFGTQYIIWAALKTNCAIKGEWFTKDGEVDGKPAQVPATIEDVFEWVESVPKETLLQIIEIWSEANNFKTDQPEVTEEQKKSPEDIVTEPSVTNSDAVS